MQGRRFLEPVTTGHAGKAIVRQRTRRVTHWQHGNMALRWAAAAFVETEKNYRRIMGYQQLWMLKATLDEPLDSQEVADRRQAG